MFLFIYFLCSSTEANVCLLHCIAFEKSDAPDFALAQKELLLHLDYKWICVLNMSGWRGIILILIETYSRMSRDTRKEIDRCPWGIIGIMGSPEDGVSVS